MRALATAALLCFAISAYGQSSEIAHPDAAVERRMKDLAEELRCLVCQNQTIADSSAPLALDLRNQIRDQVAQGKSDAQIRAYMVERYGDFVLYRPPFKATTAILWLAPALLILCGAISFVVIVRRRPAPEEPVAAPERRAEIEALLSDESRKERSG